MYYYLTKFNIRNVKVVGILIDGKGTNPNFFRHFRKEQIIINRY